MHLHKHELSWRLFENSPQPKSHNQHVRKIESMPTLL